MHDRALNIDFNSNLESAECCPPLDATRALALIESWSHLPPTRRRDLRSAVSSVVNMIRQPAGSIQLTPVYLREHILRRSPKALGIGRKRFNNIVSDLNFVLLGLGAVDAPNTPLSAPWRALKGRLDSRQGALLIAFARYCSRQAVAPNDVTSAILDTFLVWLATRTTTRNPPKLVGRLRCLWTQSSETVEGWPTQKLVRTRKPGEYILSLECFPHGFKIDLGMFARRLSGSVLDDPFAYLPGTGVDVDDEAPLSPIKPLRQTTIDLRQSHCRWAASALVATGVPISEVTDLRSLVVPLDRAQAILRFLWQRAGGKPSAAGGHVAEVLLMIARYHARLPANEIAQIQQWAKPVTLVYRGMTAKNEASIRAMMTPQREADFLELPEAFLRAARKLRLTAPAEAKTLAMRALAIEILTKIPLRLANLRGLRLDRHLQRPDPRRGRITHIVIDILDETKNSRAIRMPVSRATEAMIQEWITDFRPLVGSRDCVFLFPNGNGGNRPITAQGLRDTIKAATAEYVGVTLTPHQFRHLAARVFLQEFPGHYEEVRQLLGHASIETTIRHYSGIESEASARRFDEVVLKRRRMLKTRKEKR